MKQLLTTLILTASVFSFAQTDFNNYTSLQSKGEIPKDFYLLSSEKVTQEADLDDKLNKEFITKSRFGIDEILHSGRVTFNDELSVYVRDVAKIILKKDKETFEKLRFYTLKSRVTNAFSTDQGIIFVTTGLLSQLENEAQLAVILAHEISHFTENHVHESFIEQKQLSKNGGYMSADQKLIQMSTYSKEKEYEADMEGAELFSKSGYSTKALKTAFDILLYSYLPFDEIKFNQEFFNNDLMQIPSIYFSDTISSIRAVEDKDDSKSTHPNLKSRKAKIDDFLKGKSLVGKLNQTSTDRFLNVRNIARFETVRMSLIQRDYSRCIYETYVLYKDFPNSQYLDLTLAKAMYGLSTYKSRNKLRKVSDKLKDVEGEQFQVNFLFKELSREQLSIIALRTNQDLYLKHYPNKEFRNYRDLTLKEIIRKGQVNFDKYSDDTFANYMKSIVMDTIVEQDSTIVEEIEAGSKYDRINAKKGSLNETKVNDDEITEEEFHFFAISDLIQDKKFVELRDNLQAELDLEKEESNINDFQERKNVRKKGAYLGIKNVLVFDPIIQFAHHRKGKVHGYEDSEKKKLEYLNEIREFGDQIGIKTNLLDSKTLSSSDVKDFNALATIKEWILEVVYNETVILPSALNKEITELKKSYNFEYIFLPYIESRQKISTRYAGLFNLIPTKSRKVITEYGGLVLNVTNGEITHTFHHERKGKPKYKEISAHLYDMLLQIKSDKPKSKK